MFRNLKIGSQIGLSFALVLLIMAVVVLFARLTACKQEARVSKSTGAWSGKASCPVVFRPIC